MGMVTKPPASAIPPVPVVEPLLPGGLLSKPLLSKPPLPEPLLPELLLLDPLPHNLIAAHVGALAIQTRSDSIDVPLLD